MNQSKKLKRMQKNVLFLILILQILLTSACSKDEAPTNEQELDCSVFTDTYNSGISALIKNTCALSNCHDGANSRADLSNYEAVFKVSGMVMAQVKAQTMPPSGRSMSDMNRNRIICWIMNGLPE